MDAQDLTREDLLHLRQDPQARDRFVAELIPAALSGEPAEAVPALRALQGLGPMPLPQALRDALGTVKQSQRLLWLCDVLMETGPEGRDAVAELAAQPGARGRTALDALRSGMDRPALRGALAARLQRLAERADLPVVRRRRAAQELVHADWISALEPLKAALADDARFQKLAETGRTFVSLALPGAPSLPFHEFPTRATRDLARRAMGIAEEMQDEALAVQRRWSDRASEKETARKAGRNEPCPCGSGKKAKKCCGDARDPFDPDLAKAMSPFRVAPFDHPDAADIAAMLSQRAKPSAEEERPAVLWAALPHADEPEALVPRILREWGRDPHFRHEYAAVMAQADLWENAPDALPDFYVLVARHASPEGFFLLGETLEEHVRNPRKALRLLARAALQEGRDDGDTWRSLVRVAVDSQFHEVADLMLEGVARVPEEDREELLFWLSDLGIHPLPDEKWVERCQGDERRLAQRLLGLLQREDLDHLEHATLDNWAGELPTAEPLAEDSVEPWRAEIEARLRLLDQKFPAAG